MRVFFVDGNGNACAAKVAYLENMVKMPVSEQYQSANGIGAVECVLNNCQISARIDNNCVARVR
jgi:hypothetical protein